MRAIIWAALAALALAACGSLAGGPAEDVPAVAGGGPGRAPEVAVHLSNLGPAPELNNEVWLNVEQPLRLADLRGRVVLIDMWTFG